MFSSTACIRSYRLCELLTEDVSMSPKRSTWESSMNFLPEKSIKIRIPKVRNVLERAHDAGPVQALRETFILRKSS